MYTSETKVLHVNKIAGVPETIVAHARREGKAFALKEIPAGRGNPLTVAKKRLDDLIDWPRVKSEADIIHLHYATNGYYGWGSKPFVLHVHGSDIRRDWHTPLLRQVITHSLAKADVVLYATPDLYEHVKQIRPDALWAPNPVPEEFFEAPLIPVAKNRVVFSSRWDNTKGLDIQLPLAKALSSKGIETVGINWGTHTAEAQAAGVKLLPKMKPDQFARFLGSATVVVGQLEYAALSMTDYQTLALNRPLVCAANVENPPALTVTCGQMSGIERDATTLAATIMDLLQNPVDEDTRSWVLERHHPGVSLAFLEDIYRSIIQ